MPPKQVQKQPLVPNSNASEEKATEIGRPITKKPTKYFSLSPIVAFYIFFTAHFIAAFHSPIQDCDEVYNYWEPTHYLTHGHGLQTWEYSPEYALRSWFYIGLHATIIYFGSWIPMISLKTTQFYSLRVVFALVCSLCEMKLFKTIEKAMNPRVAIFFMLITVTSAGMFHAAVSYLPSSFAMYTTTLAIAAFLDWTLGIGTAQGLFWLSVGTIVGWPFVGALAIPFLVEELVMFHFTDDIVGTATRLFTGLCGALVVLTIQTIVDYYFYRKVVVYPFQLAWYNIFGGSGKGPNIFGTEPWHYYIRNLLINFNLWFVLACAVVPLIFFQRNVLGQAASRLPFFRTLIMVSPFYFWLAIFTLQPHKEERFMYPIYPFLALNAALALHILVSIIDPPLTRKALAPESTPAVRFVGHKAPSQTLTITGTAILRYIKLAPIALFLFFTTTLNLSRSAGLATAYSAPLSIYAALHDSAANHTVSSQNPTVCIGKEWYRFPSSYHLPESFRPAFVASDFHGLLPGAFSEASSGFGFFPGAWLIPSGMNDENQEDLGKYTRIERCDYLVESRFASESPSQAQPDRIGEAEKGTGMWEKMKCQRFLDQGTTGTVGRLFWMPDDDFVPEAWRRKWGEYCLLQKKG